MAKRMFSLRGIIGTLVGGAGLGLLVKKSIDFADNIAKTADVAGITTKALQEYRFAADLAGVSTEQLDGRAVRQADRRAREVVERVGDHSARSGADARAMMKAAPT